MKIAASFFKVRELTVEGFSNIVELTATEFGMGLFFSLSICQEFSFAYSHSIFFLLEVDVGLTLQGVF